MRLTENDKRVLADWTAVRRLVKSGLLRSAGFGVCCDCDTAKHRREPTEGEMFAREEPSR